VHDHLVALARGARVELMMKRGLRDQPQCVGLTLRHGGRVLARRVQVSFRGHPVTGSGQRLANHGADFRREPAADDEHTVGVLIHEERAATVSLFRLLVFGIAVDAAPGPG